MFSSLWVVLASAILLPAPVIAQKIPDAAKAARVLATYRIPYRLTETQHLMVRAKLNGKGPFNFIVDTGAPMLFVANDVAKKLNVTPDKAKMGTVERLELEGGAVLTKIPARIEDPMQLRGMNAMGLAGAKLDGILGYNVLARFRMEIDLTQTSMVWHHLDYTPPLAVPIVLDPKEAEKPTAGMANMERMANMASMLMRKRSEPTLRQRGFIGVELKDEANGVTIQAVLPESPAAQAGLTAGDRILMVTLPDKSVKSVRSSQELTELTANIIAGKVLRFQVEKEGTKREVIVTAGKGGV